MVFPVFAQSSSDDELDKFAPSFRSGHNLSLFLSGEYVNWSTSQILNTDDETNYILPVNDVKPVLGVFVRYTYHINIISAFGFFIGSTAGVLGSNGSYGKQKNFYPGFGVSFPSVLGGLVQGIGQDFRLLTGIEYTAVWFPQMKINTVSGVRNELNPSLDMISIFAGMDHFLTRTTAVSLNAGYRKMTNPGLNSGDSSIYLNKLRISGEGYFAQLGVTWLIGDFNQLL